MHINYSAISIPKALISNKLNSQIMRQMDLGAHRELKDNHLPPLNTTSQDWVESWISLFVEQPSIKNGIGFSLPTNTNNRTIGSIPGSRHHFCSRLLTNLCESDDVHNCKPSNYSRPLHVQTSKFKLRNQNDDRRMSCCLQNVLQWELFHRGKARTGKYENLF